MKEISEMNRQEVINEISQTQLQLDWYNERMFDLDHALTHNFPKLIGGNDGMYNTIHVPHTCGVGDCLTVISEGHIYCDEHKDLLF